MIARFVRQTGSNTFVDAGSYVSASSSTPLWVEVLAGDNKDRDSFADAKSKGQLSCQVEGGGSLKKVSTGKWRVPVGLSVGHKTATVVARDNSGNEARTTCEIDILDFKPGKATGLGNRLFILDSQFQIVKAVTVSGSGSPKVERVTVADQADYYGQDVVAMRAFPCVPVKGERVDLLLVTTSPRVGDDSHQSVLWAFKAYGNHSLVFAVSLGPGTSGYSPTLDCRDGIIAVGRLCNSVLLIDATKAKTGWENWKQYGDERGAGFGGKQVAQCVQL